MKSGNLSSKIIRYKQVLENTVNYRLEWHNDVKPMLLKELNHVLKALELPKAEVLEKNNIENLEAVVLDLGRTSSGITENLEDTGVKRTMIKSNGSLIYQQLFNGKIMVMIMSPHIEGYGEPKPPLSLEILRPDELKVPFVIRHAETFLRDITEWEDYDDEQPNKTGQGFNPIGFNTEPPNEE
ncbi:MAG: hypothetical protein IPG79_06030 [Saprospiraceae bacterium]|nr:hypothetical protein [Saprospiraceae bacterium]